MVLKINDLGFMTGQRGQKGFGPDQNVGWEQVGAKRKKILFPLDGLHVNSFGLLRSAQKFSIVTFATILFLDPISSPGFAECILSTQNW